MFDIVNILRDINV